VRPDDDQAGVSLLRECEQGRRRLRVDERDLGLDAGFSCVLERVAGHRLADLLERLPVRLVLDRGHKRRAGALRVAEAEDDVSHQASSSTAATVTSPEATSGSTASNGLGVK
jgi:hypothetical protein